jgi:hypothetical protein
MQKNNCTAVLQGPGKQNRTSRRITALQCCKVLGRKFGHAKEQLHYTVAQSRQESWTSKRITALQCCKVLGRKSGLEKRTTALRELPGPGKPEPGMQKDNYIAVLQVHGRKIGQLHSTIAWCLQAKPVML